jgi:hypothetical protein
MDGHHRLQPLELGRKGNQIEKFIEWLDSDSTEWAFQLEKGEGGKLHYQAAFWLTERARGNEVKRELAKLDLVTGHMSQVADMDKEAALAYCTKDQTRVGGPWTSEDEVRTWVWSGKPVTTETFV